MKFTRLHMKDFRAVRELDIDFEPDLTVIVGRNGAGKTSILDVLAGFLREFVAQWKRPDRKRFYLHPRPQDVRSGATGLELKLRFEAYDLETQSVREDFASIRFDADTHMTDLGLSRTFGSSNYFSEYIPGFIYYRQDRGFWAINHPSTTEEMERLNRPDAVRDRSLNEDMQALGDLAAWWDQRDADEARRVRDGDRDYRDPQLEAIRNLIAKIDNFATLHFSATESPPGLYFVKTEGTPVHVSGLSGGERSYLVLLADLARRLQVFAPDQPLEEIPAIVLIDEIELNLHPAWQSEIATTLTSVFKACQFIVATHSPQVLSGVESRQVRILEEDPPMWGTMKVTTPLSTKGRTSNYLLEGVFGASERYPPIGESIDKFNRAIDESDGESAAGLLAEIEEGIEEDAATLLVLRKRLKKLRAGA